MINLAYRFERTTFELATLQQQASIAALCGTAPALVSGSSCGTKQVGISGAWPIGAHWSVFARAIYSLLDHQALERFVGFEYRSCCWSIRFGARRYVALRPVGTTQRTGTQVTGVYLQVELNGLASVGSAPDRFLSEAIPGYTSAEPNSLAAMP
ncbi:LPS-assembly protein [mine drainage metagenome]|uniref:LPS-assembly protein n=1 Tax=mine drainage metagenome TaxID=410659 RepID=T1BEY1_9ZZZZ